MGQALHILGIDSMSVEDRIALVQDIWDSVAIDTGLLPPTSIEMEELNLRLNEDDSTPADTVTWESIKVDAIKRWQQ